MRTLGAFPIRGANQDFALPVALLALKFVNRHVPRIVFRVKISSLVAVRFTASSSASSPCEARAGRGLRRGETNKDEPPLPNPLHPMEEKGEIKELDAALSLHGHALDRLAFGFAIELIAHALGSVDNEALQLMHGPIGIEWTAVARAGMPFGGDRDLELAQLAR